MYVDWVLLSDALPAVQRLLCCSCALLSVSAILARAFALTSAMPLTAVPSRAQSLLPLVPLLPPQVCGTP